MTMRKWLAAVLVGGGLAALGVLFFPAPESVHRPGAAGAPEALAQARPSPLERGKTLYQRECATCHGLAGKGDGDAAYLLFPKPRDLTTGVFKLRSTPSGEPPADDDLLNTLTRGMPGSAMPSFSHLPAADRRALVAYLKELAGIKARPAQLLRAPQAPPESAALLQLGAQVYRKLGCDACHGVGGRGEGPSADTLKDEQGRAIRPNDFSRGIFKGGARPEDIFLRLNTGMDGTPMPSYQGTVPEGEMWALVRYVLSLSGKREALQPSGGTLTAGRVPGELPRTPMEAAWEKAPAASVPVMALWQRREVPLSLSVRALHNGSAISLLLEWEDDKPALEVLRTEDFADAAAIQFALGRTTPPFLMGAKGSPVHIWQWRADRQLDLARFRDVEDAHPNIAVDDYPYALGDYPKGVESLVGAPQAPAAAHPREFLSALAAGNPLATPWPPSAVQELNAEGFGTLTPQPPEEQQVEGQGIWAAGKWRVVFRRALRGKGERDVSLQPGASVPIAFALWDGNRGDRGGQKSVSTWYTLRLAR